MGFLSKWRIHKSVSDGNEVHVSEKGGVRLMQLGNDTVHSAMRINRPFELELAYTRSMMAFLLFQPDPAQMLMVGLGGGSLPKFVHARMSQTHTSVVEISPEVVAAARAYFFLPPDDARLSVEVGEGGAYVAAHQGGVDVLMVDGFDAHSQVEALATQSFYDACRQALTDHGVLVVNLWGSDQNFDMYLKRIETSFDGLVLCLPTEKRGNVIAFGFQKSPGMPRWDELRERARNLEAAYGLEFLRFLEGFKTLNLFSQKRLLV